MLNNVSFFLQILKRRNSGHHSSGHKGHLGHHSSGHKGHQFPPGYVFNIDEWKNHEDHTHDKDDPVMGHKEMLAKGGVSCDKVVEFWHNWLFKIPAGIHPNLVPPSNSYRAESTGIENPVFVAGNKVYMTAFVPFTKKEDNVITLQIYKDTQYILLPIITAEASTAEFPSKTQAELWGMVQSQTDEVSDIQFKIDDIPRMGCYVERKNRLTISNVANENLMGIKPENMAPNNTIDIVYNGFWALLDVKRLGSGDHLIIVEAASKTYFVGATIALNILI
jgi:hypothetical protein